MRVASALPSDYKEIFSVDLKKDKKVAVLVNGLSAVIAIIMIIAMHACVPISTLGGLQIWVRVAVLAVSIVLYIVLHEFVHGITMKMFGTKKVKYGFHGLYASAGSDDYYDIKSYIIIALAPIVVWGIILAIVNFIVPTEWFWIVYIIQIINISGAAGDMYVTVKFSGFPKDILIKDYGVGMTVYSKQTLDR